MTRLALLGGIYSNHLALRAALADARARGVDGIYCLGDLGAFGPHPDRVFPLLDDAGVRCIQGNYDNSLAGGLADCQCGYTDPRDNFYARLSYHYTFRSTSEANKRWMGTLPQQLRLEVEGRRLLLCHGSPRRMNEFLWESATSDSFLAWSFDQAGADLIAATHTGIKWQRRLPDGRLFVNVGVLGRPENDGNTHVWYTLLTVERGDVAVQYVPVQYDYQALAQEMREEQLPQAFIDTILSGWWTTCLEVLPHKERARGRF